MHVLLLLFSVAAENAICLQLARAEEEYDLLAGLYLPTSDLDLVILNSGCTDIPAGLKALANCLVRRDLAKSIQVGGLLRPSACLKSLQQASWSIT